MRRRQFRDTNGEDHIGGHSSPSTDMRFDSPSPQTPHPNYDRPSSTPTEVRGSSTPTATPDNRPMICPLGFSFDNNLCKRDISRIIQSKFEGPYPSWKKTDRAVREMWYGEFKKNWSWDSALEHQIRANFEKTAFDRMTDILFRVRKDLNKKPSWMPLSVFEALKEYWNSAEFKDKSEKGKKNRASDVGGSMHTCSSVPMSEHKKRLSRQFGRPPTQAELFLATHRRKDNSEFVDRRSEDTYMRQHEASSQSSTVGHSEDSEAGQPSHPAIDDRSLWLEVAGGKKKGRVYGMGSEAHIIPGSYYVPTPQPPPQPSSSVSLSDQIQEAVRVAIEPFNQGISAIEDRLHYRSSSSSPQNPSDHWHDLLFVWICNMEL
ncbi:uncharacterized protein LOC127787696 [Diospyros lotus]|uniref:uncharacterized protein LOC127787696 n=1 Tax=Diospyros lotus TaxID=55363 RepID=UPI00224FF133|nr:uncharacterized protein LOC127787696 [Diospyros lotus]